jgi:hypothetical protein
MISFIIKKIMKDLICNYCHEFFHPNCDCEKEIVCSQCSNGAYCTECIQKQHISRECKQCHQMNKTILFHYHSRFHPRTPCYHCSLKYNLCDHCLKNFQFDVSLKEYVELFASIAERKDDQCNVLFKLNHRGNLFMIPYDLDTNSYPFQCRNCFQEFYVVLADILVLYGCITFAFFKENYELCPKCFIDYLILSSENTQCMWNIWEQQNNTLFYVQWLPEEVFMEITTAMDQKYKPIGSYKDLERIKLINHLHFFPGHLAIGGTKVTV